MAVPVLFFLLVAVACCSAEQSEDGLQAFLELAEAEGIVSAEQAEQLGDLAKRVGVVQVRVGGPRDRGRQDEEMEPAKDSLFMKMYNHLTLLNVLYFSGALLIMGAYTLFMTLAFESCDSRGLSVVMSAQLALLGCAGVTLWNISEDFQFVGGIFCSISCGLVPYTVYHLQKALKVWPEGDPGPFIDFRNYVRGGWVVMEGATILVGLAYLLLVDFPFLLFPVAFGIWFLSMDLAPLVPGWTAGYARMFEIRRQLSVAFGVGMLVAGWIMERLKGSHPDFGFWLYLFGLIAFWFSVTFEYPTRDLYASIYLLVNVGLGLIGSHLNRTTFHVFGTIGVIVYVHGLVTNRIRSEGSVVLWVLKALAAAALFSQALRREGNIEILGGLVCLLAFNFDAIHFLGSGEQYHLFTLLTNLGFVACVPSFARPLPLWLFTVPSAQLPLSLICSATVAIYHAGTLPYLASPQKVLFSPASIAYHTYRLIASIMIAFVFYFVRQPEFAWIGALGFPVVAASFSPVLREGIKRRDPFPYTPKSYGMLNSVACVVLVFGITFSNFIESNILYLICCLALSVVTFSFLAEWKDGGCVVAVALILLSIPLQSKFMITIGTIYVFAYLSYLAYHVFKNSLLFPLTLIALGILIIFSGIAYQRNHMAIEEAFDGFIPDFITVLLTSHFSTTWQARGALDWYHYLKQTSFSLHSLRFMPFNWIMWPAALVHALAEGAAPFVSYLCGAGIVLLLATAALLKLRESLIQDLHREITVSELKFSLSRDPAHAGHGLMVSAKGTKPAHLEAPPYIAFDVHGESFWKAASGAFGEWVVSMGRSMFLPYKLKPAHVHLTNFEVGKTEFSATVYLGTGTKGSHKISHATIKDTLAKLLAAKRDAHITLTLLYAKAWSHPYSKLFEQSIPLATVSRDL